MIWTITQISTEADSPLDLRNSSLGEHQPNSIIVLKLRYFIGNLSAHDMTDDQGSPNVLKAIQTVSSKAHEVFPDIPIFPAFGNNDIPGHYVLPINRSDPWYETVLTGRRWFFVLVAPKMSKGLLQWTRWKKPSWMAVIIARTLQVGSLSIDTFNQVGCFRGKS